MPHGFRRGGLRQSKFILRTARSVISNASSPGWHFEVNNDPSWRTVARGRALVGAAFLGSLDGFGMWLIQPEPGFSCVDIWKLARPRISGQVYRDDGMHGFRLDSRALKLKDGR